MKIALQKIHHLIRYFLVFAVIAFIGYTKQLNDGLFLIITGPCLYIAYHLKSFFTQNLIALNNTEAVNYYFFLFPVCLVYFGFIGFQMKQLWNERGKIRFIIMTAFISFLIYIHILAAKNLSVYLA
jgi:hypothetical protein